jgi:hypothetical protein
MNDLDFLPIEYREEYERWRLQPWQIGAAVIVVVLVSGAASFQHYRWRLAQQELAAVTPLYEKAVSLQSRLLDVQGQLKQVQTSVGLHEHLRRSGRLGDLLAALVSSPDDVVLEEVHVARDTAGDPSARGGKSATSDSSSIDTPLTAAARDLTKMRRRNDAMQTIVVLNGTAANIGCLRQFLAALETTRSFENAELTRLDRLSSSGGRGGLRFKAVLAITPNAEGDSP